MKLQEWLGKTAQTSGPIQNLAKFFFTKNQMKTGLFHNNLQSLVDSLSQLSPDEVDGYDEIWRLHNTEGKNLEDILADPKYTEKTRAAVKETANGARRYLVNEHIVMNDVTGVRGLDGKIHIYTSKGAVADIVLAARDRLRKATRDFGNALDASDRLKRWLDRVDANRGRMAQQLKQGLDQARQAVKTAEDRTENIKRVTTDEKGKEHVSTFGKKGEAYDRLVAPGGLIEQVVQAMEEGRMDEAMTLLKPLRDRLSEWGDKSVDATEAQAFQGIAAQLDSLDKLMERRKKVDAELHNRMVGEEKITTRLKNEDVVRRRAEKKEMQDRHTQERKDLRAQKRLAKGRVKQARDKRMADLDAAYQRNVDVLYTRADQAAERATKAQADAIYKQTKREHNAMRSVWFEAKNRENLKYDKMELAGELDVAKEEPKLMKRQQREADELAKNQKWWELFHGSMAEEMKNYNDTLDEFKKAVEDNPTDNYQPMELALFMQHLMDHEKSARLIDETEQKLTKDWDESRLDALHKNPDLLKEQVWLYARDVYLHPDNYEPDLVNFTNQVMNDVIDSGTKELKVLIAQGYDPLWLPRADVNDRQKSAIHVEVGKGTPHIDAAHERIHDLAPTRHDTFLGVSKDMAQALSRDAHIEMVVDYLMPLGITGKELEGQLHNIPGWEDIDVGKATSLAYDAVALKKLGLTRFDSEATFGFMPPTWAGEAVYLPTGLANGLQKMMDLEKSGDKGPFDKINQVFRYSILGLSPRYTAHILFGGTFLLALRSTPYMPLMIGKAFRSMKNGDNPEEIYRQPTQEGFSRMQQALTAKASASGQQLSLFQIQEHIEKTQHVLLSKASGYHYVKAAADLNFKFTRWVTRFQTSIAYWDYYAKAERKGYFINPETGEKMAMTKERAAEEGMNHVLQVFGDLRSMSPLERQIAKNVLPFYGWTRHILKYVLSMPVDHPWRAVVLALIAYENSADVPKGLPERIQFLFFLGSPDKEGNVSAIDTRFMDPLRDVANYASLGGWIQGLNPVFLAPAAMMDPQLVYGSTSLYPNLTYNDMYGIETAGAQGNLLTGLQQVVPQLGALGSAMQAAGNYRQAASNPNSFYKSIFNSLNIPFAQVQKINVKQIAAHDAQARYEVAKQASQNAFSSGDFGSLAGYKTVPNPLNPDYEITPQALEAVYNQAIAEYPGQQPINVITPPQSPFGY